MSAERLERLGRILADARARRKLGAREAASACGISHAYLLRLERGLQDPRISTVAGILAGIGDTRLQRDIAAWLSG